MLVVQVTPVSLLASGLDRVLAVVTGVFLAVAFAAVVPLEWWSLGLLIFVAIMVGPRAAAAGQPDRGRDQRRCSCSASGRSERTRRPGSGSPRRWWARPSASPSTSSSRPRSPAPTPRAPSTPWPTTSVACSIARPASSTTSWARAGTLTPAAQGLARRGAWHHPRRDPPGRRPPSPTPSRAGDSTCGPWHAGRRSRPAPGVRGPGALRGVHPIAVPGRAGRDRASRGGSTRTPPTTCSSAWPRRCASWRRASTRSGSWSATRPCRWRSGRPPTSHALRDAIDGLREAQARLDDLLTMDAGPAGARAAGRRGADGQATAARDGPRAAGPAPGPDASASRACARDPSRPRPVAVRSCRPTPRPSRCPGSTASAGPTA